MLCIYTPLPTHKSIHKTNKKLKNNTLAGILTEFNADITYIQGTKNNVADVFSCQVEPRPGMSTLWLPVNTITVQFIHSNSMVGEVCKERILLETDEFHADDVRLAQCIEFPGLFDHATDMRMNQNYEISLLS